MQVQTKLSKQSLKLTRNVNIYKDLLGLFTNPILDEAASNNFQKHAATTLNVFTFSIYPFVKFRPKF